MVKRASGFTYHAERPNATSFVEQKWGWTGLKPGAHSAWWPHLPACASCPEPASVLAPSLPIIAVPPPSLPLAAGDWAELEFDTRANPDATEAVDAEEAKATANIWLSYLKSYQVSIRSVQNSYCQHLVSELPRPILPCLHSAAEHGHGAGDLPVGLRV